MKESYYLGVDIGTGSARAGLFTGDGRRIATCKRDITIWRPRPDYVQQSSDDIWEAVCHCVRNVIEQSGADPGTVRGIGFDATCSLVLVDNEGRPVTVSLDGEPEQNIIVWMDHRAMEETAFINAAGKFPVFDFVGGTISVEMQTPKLLWLKKHLPDSWRRAGHFFDLPDYLTFRATGATTRSLCSMVCKWTYLGHEGHGGIDGWCASYFRAIGLGDLADNGYQRIGVEVRPMGEPVGRGLTEQAARDLRLRPGTAVGVSIIDAHAGGLGLLGTRTGDQAVAFDRRLALIGGTSSCHMAVSADRRAIPGVWGPYYSAMVPGYWLNEGGQSATGSLIDHVIFTHNASEELRRESSRQGVDPYTFLNQRLETMRGNAALASLTSELHVCPYFHGNRSPRANPHLVGMISGLRLSATLDDLARLYLATVQAVACGTRHIIDTLNERGYRIDTMLVCGGGAKNPVFLQQHADVTQCRLVLPDEQESVLLGSAMLAARAAGDFASLEDAMQRMSGAAKVLEPDRSQAPYHRRKHNAFLAMHEHQRTYSDIMNREDKAQ